MAATRSQARTRKRVRFADEAVDQEGDTHDENQTRNVLSEVQHDEPQTGAQTQSKPSAGEADPVSVQEGRRRRIAKAQDAEQRLSNLKAVLRGEVEELGYRAARDTLSLAD